MVWTVTEADLPRCGRRRNIDRRGEGADRRDEAGHWEMDTVKGPQNGSSACLLTLTERKLRAQIIRKLPDGKAASVVAALDALDREHADTFPLLFKSVTADNGVEFSDYRGLERSCVSAGNQ